MNEGSRGRKVMVERLERLRREDLPQFESIFADLEKDQGYVSRSLFMFARNPALMRAVGLMHDAAWYGKALDEPTRDFAAYAFTMFRNAAYSAAHCAANAERHGFPRDKILAINESEKSPLYNERERALLAFCKAAAAMPSQMNDDIFARLSRSFSAAEVISLTSLMSMMALLTTWNSIMATEIEPAPLAYGEAVLSKIGWDAGQHR